MCCFGSVRNFLFLNIQELRGEARGGGIQAFPSLVFLYGVKYPLPSCESESEPYGRSDYLQPSLFHMDDFMFP